jgi:hypothetical protein
VNQATIPGIKTRASINDAAKAVIERPAIREPAHGRAKHE